MMRKKILFAFAWLLFAGLILITVLPFLSLSHSVIFPNKPDESYLQRPRPTITIIPVGTGTVSSITPGPISTTSSGPVGTGSLTPTPGGSQQPALTISPDSAYPGDTLTVTGEGFTPGEMVQVYFEETRNGVVSATTTASGSFSVLLHVPGTYNPTISLTPAAIFYVYVTGSTGGEKVKAAFYFKPMLRILNPPIFENSFWLGGQGYLPGEAVAIFWSYRQLAQAQVSAVIADQSGAISFGLNAPSAPGPDGVNVAAVGARSGAVAISYLHETPGIFVKPAVANPGSPVQVSGGCFGSYETVVVTFQEASGTITVAKVTTDKSGAFTTTFVAPNFTGPGNVTIHATGNSSGVSASATFGFQPTLTITPTTGSVGTTITVTGYHFTAFTAPGLFWSDTSQVGNDDMFLTKPSVNSSGILSGIITVPVGYTLIKGHTYYIQAMDPITQAWAEASFLLQ